MKGTDLIKWIQENNAEDIDIVVCYEPYVGEYDEPSPKIKDGMVYLN
jgi:hypothetical protein